MAPSPKREPGEPVARAVERWLTGQAARQRIAVAFSGGVDSLVLLHALKAARDRDRPDLDLSACHIHHGLQPQADAWADHALSLGQAWNVPVVVKRVCVAQPSRRGLEAAAREARYTALAQLDVDCVVLAHHADDQAETVLLQLLRGGTPRALAAMPAVRWVHGRRFERPLLNVSRDEILAYAARHALEPVFDPANSDSSFARSRLRTTVWPSLRAAFPQVTERLVSAAQQQAEVASLLDALADLDLAACTSSAALSLSAWRALDPPRRRNALRRWLERHDIPAPPRSTLLDWEWQLTQSRPDRGVVLTRHTPDAEFEIRSWRGHAYLLRRAAPPSEPELPEQLTGPGRWVCAFGELVVALSSHNQRTVATPTPILALPVPPERVWTLRRRAPGDTIRLSASSGRVALKTLFESRGVAPWLRPHWPLLCHRERVIAVAGLAVDYEYASASGLLIEWHPALLVARRSASTRPGKTPGTT
ncbi:MAG: tRNA lysidine(34) synthetase TilS [Casimicrobiaceae bacterium]|nr:tRNA lysidine(34) synthetase TilS [Casimicrobiaceae bacterium]MDW8312902.1 tRNA lysidine(34) synthetase TilS [Burkholderiales bacterium]